MIPDKFKYGAIVGLLILLFLGQWYYSSVIADLQGQITAMELEARQAEIEALDRQREVELEWQAKADQAAVSASAQLAEVESRYERALDGLLSDADRVQQPGGAGGNATALPNSAAASGGAETARAGNGCKPCGGGVKRLSQDIMTLARDCDITASRYNELLRLWHGVSEQNE